MFGGAAGVVLGRRAGLPSGSAPAGVDDGRGATGRVVAGGGVAVGVVDAVGTAGTDDDAGGTAGAVLTAGCAVEQATNSNPTPARPMAGRNRLLRAEGTPSG